MSFLIIHSTWRLRQSKENGILLDGLRGIRYDDIFFIVCTTKSSSSERRNNIRFCKSKFFYGRHYQIKRVIKWDSIEQRTILFGLIMALSFTCSISVANIHRAEIGPTVFGAIGCKPDFLVSSMPQCTLSEFWAKKTEIKCCLNIFKIIQRQTRQESIFLTLCHLL